MTVYSNKTTGETIKCETCGNTEFKRTSMSGDKGVFIAFECENCRFVAIFPRESAPTGERDRRRRRREKPVPPS